MFFAPKFTPEKRRGRFTRTIRNTGFGGLALFVPLLAAALFFYSQYSVPSQKLYHHTWQRAAETIYDPSDLGNWADWEHKYDGKIHSDDDAIAAANEALQSAGDPYTYLMSPEKVKQDAERASGNFVGVGMVFAVQPAAAGKTTDPNTDAPLPQVDKSGYPVVQSVMTGAPAAIAGIQAGDTLLRVNGVDTRGVSLDAIVAQVRGPIDTKVDLVFSRDGKEFPVTLTRSKVKLSSVHAKMLPSTNIGYIRLDDFGQNDATEQFRNGLNELKDAEALIVDLRGNPGGFVFNAINISSFFIKTGVVVTIKERVSGDPAHPVYRVKTTYLTDDKVVEEGYSTDNPTSVRRSARDRQPYLAADRQVIFLVDEGSASASEMTTGAVHDNGAAIVVGQKTFGKGVGQSTLFMPNGTRLHVTSLRYYTPKGTWLGNGRAKTGSHGEVPANGITPDVEVKPVKPHFERGSPDDNQLQRAIELLKK